MFADFFNVFVKITTKINNNNKKFNLYTFLDRILKVTKKKHKAILLIQNSKLP